MQALVEKSIARIGPVSDDAACCANGIGYNAFLFSFFANSPSQVQLMSSPDTVTAFLFVGFLIISCVILVVSNL
jgi:hypothetical protein